MTQQQIIQYISQYDYKVDDRIANVIQANYKLLTPNVQKRITNLVKNAQGRFDREYVLTLISDLKSQLKDRFDVIFQLQELSVEQVPQLLKIYPGVSTNVKEQAVRFAGELIKYIEDPTQKMQKTAVSTNYNNIMYIKNPVDSVKEIVLQFVDIWKGQLGSYGKQRNILLGYFNKNNWSTNIKDYKSEDRLKQLRGV